MSENSPAFVLVAQRHGPGKLALVALVVYSAVMVSLTMLKAYYRQRRISEDTLERINRQEKVIEAPNH
ncbi:hypothetical protein AOT31_10975 [Corynebacterium ulcerans]|nr:hypothetical protein [Corynebacterium ulcerans]KPJ23479.1 hypothetical protein AOT31_10975 [Corynebacterium ulcerans]